MVLNLSFFFVCVVLPSLAMSPAAVSSLCSVWGAWAVWLGWVAWLCGLCCSLFCLGLCLGLVGWLVLLSCVFGLGLGTDCLTVGCVKPPGFAWFCPFLQMPPAIASGQLGVGVWVGEGVCVCVWVGGWVGGFVSCMHA